MSKPSGERYTVAVDFDGVIHAYTSSWKNARTIPDGPVPGAMRWLIETSRKMHVAIFTTRNHQFLGKRAVKRWLVRNLAQCLFDSTAASGARAGYDLADVVDDCEKLARDVVAQISFPARKPPALLYIDDRGYRFDGTNWPTVEQIHKLRPWNKL